MGKGKLEAFCITTLQDTMAVITWDWDRLQQSSKTTGGTRLYWMATING